jgi:FAD/FMN-containing dehydrogenase/DNA-binding HxlR family transcriptional regulator
MAGYGQFCPIARASEVLAERWTPIIVRNLLLGCRTFNDIADGAPGLSRSLLSKRLRELERAGIILIRPKPTGRGSIYELTRAGRDLWPVIGSLREWGARWVELAPHHVDPGMVLWAWATSCLERDRLPEARVVVRFEAPSQPPSRRRGWLLVQNRDIEVCTTHPGFDEDLLVVVEDDEVLVRWHLGELRWEDAVACGAIRVEGPPALARALPTWHRPDRAPGDERRERLAEAGRRARAPVHAGTDGTPVPRFAGEVLTASDQGYDGARRVWNGAIDRHPRYILRCTDAHDVAAGVRFARDHDLRIAVRGGGHSFAGLAVCDGGVVIDASPMKGVHVDPAQRAVEAEPGVVWGELDAASQGFGLATTGGIVSGTGIAGLTLGGGLGWLMRRHGLTADNLLAAEVVTADGDIVTADAGEQPDLLWGLRGGGGNFGIVTRFRYRCHPVGEHVLAGPVLWSLDDAPDVLAAYAEVVATAPRELATMVILRHAPSAPFLPVELHRRPVCVIVMCFVGDLPTGERVMAPLRGLGSPLADLVDATPYTAFQASHDASAPPGWHYYGKSVQLGRLGPDAIDAVVDHAGRLPTDRSAVLLYHLGGAVADPHPGATAWPWRDTAHSLMISGAWLPSEPVGDETRTWARRFHTAMGPFERGVYVNFLDRDDHHRVAAAYGDETYRRLARLKARVDPDNVFRANHNILPSPAPARDSRGHADSLPGLPGP